MVQSLMIDKLQGIKYGILKSILTEMDKFQAHVEFNLSHYKIYVEATNYLD